MAYICVRVYKIRSVVSAHVYLPTPPTVQILTEEDGRLQISWEIAILEV